MRIVDRYLLKGFLFPLFYCIALFSVLFVIIDSFNNLSEFLRHGVTLKVVLSYYLYMFPSLLVEIIPVSVLVAILYVLSNLNRHNELIALKASGISAFQILYPYLLTGLVISFGIFLLNEAVVPPSKITSRAIMDGLILKGKKNLEERAIKNVTLYGKKNRMIFAREYEIMAKTLHDVVIFESRGDQILKSKLSAKKAKYEGGVWTFYDVIEYRLNRRGDIDGDPKVSQKVTLDMEEKPEDFIKEASQVEFMTSRQLKEYIEQMKGTSKKLTRRLWVDWNYRIALPFVSFIVMLIGAPLAMKTERGSAVVGIGTSLAVVLSYYAVASVCLALGKGGYLPTVLSAWFGNLLFALVGIYLIKKTS